MLRQARQQLQIERFVINVSKLYDFFNPETCVIYSEYGKHPQNKIKNRIETFVCRYLISHNSCHVRICSNHKYSVSHNFVAPSKELFSKIALREVGMSLP